MSSMQIAFGIAYTTLIITVRCTCYISVVTTNVNIVITPPRKLGCVFASGCLLVCQSPGLA